MKYFKNVKTFDELKAAFRTLAMQHHPDRGGDLRTMQEINAEYDELFPEKNFKKGLTYCDVCVML